MMFMLLILFFYAGFLAAADFSPEENDTINYTHVLFQWPQVLSNVHYKITITNLNDDSFHKVNSSINAFILDEFLDWGNTYQWQVCYTSEDETECLAALTFTINELMENYPNQIKIHQYNEEKFFHGLNLWASHDLETSIAFDMDGEPVWFFDISSFNDYNFNAYEILPNGNLVGNSEYTPAGFGYEVTFDGKEVFKTESYGHHHEFIKSSKGTYFGIIHENVWVLNLCEDPVNEYVFWVGDKFVEYDQDGNILWEWSALENLNHEDFNPEFCDSPNPNSVDWTHANSIQFDEETQTVYISIRNFSRLISIDYETGNINWQIGQEEFMTDSNDVSVNFDFSGQHSIRLLENGHFIFFANNTYFNPQLSACIEFSVDTSFNEFTLEWEYTLPGSLFTHVRGECERLDNGNTLISAGYRGQLLEVDPNKELVWHYTSKQDGDPTDCVRNERVPSLYPLAFNLFLGNYYDGILTTYDNNVHLLVSNLGWLDDEFYIEIYLNDELVGSTFLGVDGNSSDWALIEIVDEIIEDQNYSIKVTPSKAQENAQQLDVFIINKVIPKDDISIFSIFPNPFNNTVYMQYSVPEMSPIEIAVINIKGQKIESLFEGSKDPGYYMVKWKAKKFSSGVYFLHISSEKYSQSQKVTLMK